MQLIAEMRSRRSQHASTGVLPRGASVLRTEVRVESKWGLYGRYLHRHEDQIYGTDYTFYRSRREGHLLQGLPDSVEPVP